MHRGTSSTLENLLLGCEFRWLLGGRDKECAISQIAEHIGLGDPSALTPA